MKSDKDLAYQDYLAGMKYKDIAEKYGVSLSTVKSWASREWKNAGRKSCNQDNKGCKKVAKRLQKGCNLKTMPIMALKPISNSRSP